MPATTDKLTIPYPLPTEKVADYPSVARQAAERIETILSETATATPQGSWTQIQNLGRLRNAAGWVQFEGIGLASVFNFKAGALNEMGVLIPAGFRPTVETCTAGAIIQNWRAYDVLIGVRTGGSVYSIAAQDVSLGKADMYNYLLIPPMNWKAAE